MSNGRSVRVLSSLYEVRHGPVRRREIVVCRGLTRARVEEYTRPYLTGREVRALIGRRDKLVEHFEALIEQKGERLVLY